jgi:hypothetical protein
MSCDADVRRFNDHLDCTVVYRNTGIMVHVYVHTSISITTAVYRLVLLRHVATLRR